MLMMALLVRRFLGAVVITMLLLGGIWYFLLDKSAELGNRLENTQAFLFGRVVDVSPLRGSLNYYLITDGTGQSVVESTRGCPRMNAFVLIQGIFRKPASGNNYVEEKKRMGSF